MDIPPVARVAQILVSLHHDPQKNASSPKAMVLLGFAYRCFAIILLFLVTTLLLINLSVSEKSVTGTTEMVFITCSYLAICLKVTYYLRKRESIFLILDLLGADICSARDADEQIALKRSEFCSKISFVFAIITFAATCFFFVVPFLAPLASRPLPIDIYRLYDLGNVYVYVLTYCLCEISVIQAASFSIFIDTTFYQLLNRMVEQISLLSHRLGVAVSSLGTDNGRFPGLVECIYHQMHLRKVKEKICSVYASLFVQQVIICLLTLSSVVFQATKNNGNAIETLKIYICTLSALLQIFLYCFHGDGFELKSSSVTQSIYDSDWMSLKPKDRKDLILIMSFTQKKLDISFHGITPMNYKTMKWILQATYSTFNILNQLQKNI